MASLQAIYVELYRKIFVYDTSYQNFVKFGAMVLNTNIQ